MAFPSNILSLADAIGSQFLSLFFGGSVAHSTGVNAIKNDLIAVETKVGTGASTPTANTVLRGTGSGTSAFGQIVNGDITAGTITNAAINAAAAIARSKLDFGSGLVNADIAAAAAIAYSKLALGTSIVNADVAAAAAIAVSKLAAGAANSVLTSNGTTDSFSATPTVTSLTATGSVTGTTDVRSGTKFFPSAQVVIGLSTPVAATVTSGNSALINAGSGQGFVFVSDLTNGRNAIFEIESGGNAVALLVGDPTVFTIAAAAADNKIHGIFNGGNYFLYNGFGVSHVLYASYLGTA